MAGQFPAKFYDFIHMTNPIKDESDLARYKEAYKVIRELEEWDKISPGNKNNFTVVRNYMANAIADYVTDKE